MLVKFESFEEANAVYTFTDVRGFTQWSRRNPGDMKRLAALIYNIADEVCESKTDAKYRRRVVKNLGDGCFWVNEYKKDKHTRLSATTAFMQVVQFHHYFHESLRQSNIHGRNQLQLGFGVTYGASHRFYTRGQSIDYIGEKINLASRFCAKAEANQVVFEPDLKEYHARAMELLEVATVDVDEHVEELRGYGQVEYLTCGLSFSSRVLQKIYSIGHDSEYLPGLLAEL